MNIMSGEYLRREKLNFKRLCDDIYQSPKLFSMGGDWAGDFQGRAILALSCLYQSLEGYQQEQKQIEKQLNSIFDNISQHLNAHYYFGNEFNGDFVDEQQVSGNSWYIRGLCEYYSLTKNPKYLDQLQNIINYFLIPIAKFYKHYPIEQRSHGGVGGHLTNTILDGWKISTDIGCAFIMMDGYSKAYEILKDNALLDVINIVFDAFLKIDFVKIQYQTHATLSFARGCLRMYEITHHEKFLNAAMDIFSKYEKYGMTYDFANTNWFNNKSSWTEPCCIIDSVIICKKLYEITNDLHYLTLFNRIFQNGIRTFQRNNGGAGCSTCAIDNQYKLKMFMYEAFFCCTMRMGEYFKETSNFFSKLKNDSLYINFNADGVVKGDGYHIEINNDIYNHDHISIKIIKRGKLKRIMLYVPTSLRAKNYSNEGEYLVCELDNEQIDIEFEIDVIKYNHIYLLGDLVLTKKDEKVDLFFNIDNEKFSPLYDNSQYNEEELSKKVQYVR